jgi:DNA (cytosine-5)-methyltransferase 1
MREGKEGGGKGPLVSEDQVLAFKGGQGSGAGSLGASEYVSPTLGAADSGSNRTPTLMHGMQVRRLTPAECERLQGFPDGYTNIPWRGKPESPDGNRYKALGNSWAVPVVRWIGEQIKAIRP